MGSLQAQEFAALTESGAVPREQAIAWHLTSNHYPPVPVSMVGPCIESIEIVQRSIWGDADQSERVKLPDGISWRGQDTAPASAIVESHHLESFIQWEEC